MFLNHSYFLIIPDASNNSMFIVETIMNPAFGLCHAITPNSNNVQFGISDYLKIGLIFKEPIESTVLFLTSKEDRYGISFYGLGKIQSAHRVTITTNRDYNIDIAKSQWQHLRFKIFTTRYKRCLQIYYCNYSD